MNSSPVKNWKSSQKVLKKFSKNSQKNLKKFSELGLRIFLNCLEAPYGSIPPNACVVLSFRALGMIRIGDFASKCFPYRKHSFPET